MEFCHFSTKLLFILQVKDAYVGFLNHCYIDTEVEMKEIYSSNHMWTLFENSFIGDMLKVITITLDSNEGSIKCMF